MQRNQDLIIFMPSIEGGGVEKNLFLISNFLSLKFKNVKFITLSKISKKISKKIKIINHKFLSNNINSRFLKIILSSIFLMFQIQKNRNAVILSFQANLFAILICWIFNRKIIVRLNSSPSGWLKNNIKKKIFKTIYSLANLIIVNSKEFKKELNRNMNIKSVCIYNPLDKKNIIKKSKIKFKKNIFPNNKCIKLINIGRLVDQKDHITLLKSINFLKRKLKIKLVIIGQGRNKSKIINFIKDNYLQKNVTILNFKKNPYPYLKSSDVFILSSRYEGLPNVLLEAITLKKFIISSDCPTGPKEILDYGKGGLLFKTGSFKSLSEKILKYKRIKNKNRKINFAYNSLEKFDFKKNLNLYLKKIDEIILSKN